MQLHTHTSLRELERGSFTWQGKKVTFDPFSSWDLLGEVLSWDETQVTSDLYLTSGSWEIPLERCSLATPLGALYEGIFRAWSDPDSFTWVELLKAPLHPKRLYQATQSLSSIRWKKPLPQLRPDPVPLLELTDRTGAFANLWLVYPSWEERVMFDPHSPEGKHWESDLLEAGFCRKMVGRSHYFCSTDQVHATLSLLLGVGWDLVDCRGKRVVRQTRIECHTEASETELAVRGTVEFGEHRAPLPKVLHAQPWVDLTEHHVGLSELPAAWSFLRSGRVEDTAVHVPQTHLGAVQEILPLPPGYAMTTWQQETVGPSFKGVLFPYQNIGLNWLCFLFRSHLSGLLADAMGLGKTVQTVAFLSRHPGRILIVVPVTLLQLWKEQIATFCPEITAVLHRGPDRPTSCDGWQQASCVITSYHTLRADAQLFSSVAWDVVILDEAHLINNAATQLFQALRQLRSRFRLAITGTPMGNRIEELRALFEFLLPDLPHATPVAHLKPFILRRTKEEVGLELPEKIVQTIGVEFSEEEEIQYHQILQARPTRDVLPWILRLRQFCCHPRLLDPTYAGPCHKFSQVVQDLEEAVVSGSKVLLYSQFTSMLKLFREVCEERGWRYSYLDGATSDREEAIHTFQHDPAVRIFLLSLKAGGVGLNLQMADAVFLYDPWWNGAAEEQAMDRAHRMGRRGNVFVRKYYTCATIEAKLLELQAHKARLVHDVWDQSRWERDTLSHEDVQFLMGESPTRSSEAHS